MKNNSHQRRPGTRMPAAKRQHIPTEKIFSLGGGHVVLYRTRSGNALGALERFAPLRPRSYLTIVVDAPRDASDALMARCARAAQRFDRVLVCDGERPDVREDRDAAGRFVRAVRGAGRIECQRIADPHRALRHCIDAMLPGEVIVYCCDAFASACAILAEHAAVPVSEIPQARPIDVPASTSAAHAAVVGASAPTYAHYR